jgi:tetratricopeptide (TPR) repeat protein
MEVVDSSGKVIGSQTAGGDAEPTTEETDKDPPPIDWDAVFSQLKEGAAMGLAAAVVPSRAVVVKPWFKCGDANETCKAGLGHLRAGRFADAEASFQDALTRLAALPKPDPKATAAAYWGIVLAREFGGNYAGAREALSKAKESNPEEEAFRAEETWISKEEQNAKKLGAEAGEAKKEGS